MAELGLGTRIAELRNPSHNKFEAAATGVVTGLQNDLELERQQRLKATLSVMKHWGELGRKGSSRVPCEEGDVKHEDGGFDPGSVYGPPTML